MAYFNSGECSLSILWDSVKDPRQPVNLTCVNMNAFIDAPPMDIFTAASIGDYDIIYHAMNCSDNGQLLKRNVNGWTPLMYACYNNHQKVVQLLISFGVAKYDRNYAGRTPLMLAALNDNEHILRLVYENSTINITDKRGWSALFHAVSRRQENSVKFLLKNGAEVNIISRDNGQTVLMLAAAAGKTSVVKMLLTAGCDSSKVSWAGETAVSIAHSNGFFDIVRLLSSSARFCELPLIDLYSLFHSLELTEYWPLFQRKNIDIETFFSLTEQNLKEIGVLRLGPRKKLASTILQWQQQQRHHPSHAQFCHACNRVYM